MIRQVTVTDLQRSSWLGRLASFTYSNLTAAKSSFWESFSRAVSFDASCLVLTSTHSPDALHPITS